MSSRVRVTVSVERQGPQLDLLDSDVKLMSAGRNDSDILGDDREPNDGEVGVHIDGENVVVNRLEGIDIDDEDSFEFNGERRRVCDTGRFSGVELRRDRRVCDEVVLGVWDKTVWERV